MTCFECGIAGERVDSIGVCHHCSVGLCQDHGVLAADPILVHEPVARVVALPKKARALLCRTCIEALKQQHDIEEHAPMAMSPAAHP